MKTLLFIIALSCLSLTITAQEFLYETASFPSCHASTIAQTTSGDLLVAFFGGTYEGHPDNCIWTCRLPSEKVNENTVADNDEPRWSAPALVAEGILDGTKTACYNPVLFQIPGGELLLFYKVGPSVQQWRGFLIRSRDGGYTWSAPEPFPENQLGPVRNKPIMANGGLLCGSSFENEGWRVHFEWAPVKEGRLSEIGDTWKVTPPINDTSDCEIIQPTMWQKNDGTIQSFFRNRNSRGQIMTSTGSASTPWSKPTPTVLPSNNSGIDGVTLPDGSFLLVYNHVSGDKPKARTPICYSITKDGTTWSPQVILEDTPGMELSYPAVIRTTDSAIHITYTWHRTHIRHIRIPSQLL